MNHITVVARMRVKSELSEYYQCVEDNHETLRRVHVDILRALWKREPQGSYVRISGCDPLNPAGILMPGSRIAATFGNRVISRDGVPVAAVKNGEAVKLSNIGTDASGPLTDERLQNRGYTEAKSGKMERYALQSAKKRSYTCHYPNFLI